MKAKCFKMSLVLLQIALIAVPTVFANGGGDSESGEMAEETYVFKYGNEQPEGHSRTISMLWFAE